jgi:hypothetical protein
MPDLRDILSQEGLTAPTKSAARSTPLEGGPPPNEAVTVTLSQHRGADLQTLRLKAGQLQELNNLLDDLWTLGEEDSLREMRQAEADLAEAQRTIKELGRKLAPVVKAAQKLGVNTDPWFNRGHSYGLNVQMNIKDSSGATWFVDDYILTKE